MTSLAIWLTVPVLFYLLYRAAIWGGSKVILRSYRRPPSKVRSEFGYEHPDDLNIPNEALAVEVEPGIVLTGWLMRSTAPPRGLLVHLHGIWDSCRPRLPLAARMLPHGFDCVFYDSRGNGESGGRYCTYGLKEKFDLIKVIDAVAAMGVDTSRIALVGHSMGGATAVYASEIDPRIKALVLEACYRDLPSAIFDYARVFVPFLPRFIIQGSTRIAMAKGEFNPDELSPLKAMPQIEIPALVVQGTRDVRIKPHYARELFDAKPEPKELCMIEGARHGRLAFEGGEAYMARLEAWLCEQFPIC